MNNMKKPIIFSIDDDPQVLRAVHRDLRNNYRKQYRVLATESANEALETMRTLKNKGETVALILSDQRMPEMLGVDLLEQAKEIFPAARRVLLTAYSDTEAAIKAINDVQLDYYLMKPWNPPEEKLYPVIDDLLETWLMNYSPDFDGIRIVGYQWSPKSHAIKDFLSGNLIPYRWLDIQTNEDANRLLDINELDHNTLPVVFFADGSVTVDPNLTTIGEKAGMQVEAAQEVYDVVIIGAGPAGLAAGVYAGSEGLNALLVEKRAPGGQAGTSSRIENYLGFPKGLSGSELSQRAITQAKRFGVEFLSPQEVVSIETKDHYKIITLVDGSSVNARSIVITTGVNYRKLDAEGIDSFTGAGIYYGAANTEANACKNQDVYVVGGGNSAGQAALYLSKFAKRVCIVIRKPDLSSSMSQYLIDQIDVTDNINLLPRSVITSAQGQDRLTSLSIKNLDTEIEDNVEAAVLLIFIGAKPYTDWIPGDIIKDERGFIQTGPSIVPLSELKKVWKIEREPYLLETSTPGIFAAGDVRSGAMNRVASAVGEGAMAIKFVHQYLAEN